MHDLVQILKEEMGGMEEEESKKEWTNELYLTRVAEGERQAE